MIIHIARHGETENNALHIAMGQTIDDSLNERGIAQAHQLAGELTVLPELIISSRLKRCLETAEIVAANLGGVPIEVIPGVEERHIGSLAGKYWPDITAEHGIQPNIPVDYTPFGGESMKEIEARVQKALAHIAERWAGRKVLLITHRGVIFFLYRLYGRVVPNEVQNASIFEFEY